MVDELRPIPDPSTLTREALDKESLAIRELLETRIKSNTDLSTERFKAIDARFTWMDAQVATALVSQKEASENNFRNNKESIAKSEAVFTKQLEALELRFGDLRDRINRGEAKSGGMVQLWSIIVGGIGAISLVVGIILTIEKMVKLS